MGTLAVASEFACVICQDTASEVPPYLGKGRRGVERGGDPCGRPVDSPAASATSATSATTATKPAMISSYL